MADNFECERREGFLEDVVHDAETELEEVREELGRLDEYSTRLLGVLGVSGKKADFIYSVLDLEGDESRVKSVTLRNSDVLTAEVSLTRSFRDIDTLRNYLEKHGLQGGDFHREGAAYRLQKPELGVAVYFSVQE